MDNQNVNQTELAQMPQGMNGTRPPEHHPHEHGHTGRSIFIALLIVILAAFLGYWYFTAPKDVPEVSQIPQQPAPTSQVSNDDLMAAAIESEAELDSLYFENVSEGM